MNIPMVVTSLHQTLPVVQSMMGYQLSKKRRFNDILPVFETGFCYTQSLVFEQWAEKVSSFQWGNF